MVRIRLAVAAFQNMLQDARKAKDSVAIPMQTPQRANPARALSE
jgi:hypothetical protein